LAKNTNEKDNGKNRRFTSHFDLNLSNRSNTLTKERDLKKRERNLEKILNEVNQKIDSLRYIKDTKLLVSINADTLGLLKCSIALNNLDLKDFLYILSNESEHRYNEFMKNLKNKSLK